MASAHGTYRALRNGRFGGSRVLRQPLGMSSTTGMSRAGLLLILGEPLVLASLFGVDPIPIVPGHRHGRGFVRLGSHLHGLVGMGHKVPVPVRVRVSTRFGCKDVAVPVKVRIHHWIDPLQASLRPNGVKEQNRGTSERSADPAFIRSKLLDDLAVPVLDFAHSPPSLLSWDPTARPPLDRVQVIPTQVVAAVLRCEQPSHNRPQRLLFGIPSGFFSTLDLLPPHLVTVPPTLSQSSLYV